VTTGTVHVESAAERFYTLAQAGQATAGGSRAPPMPSSRISGRRASVVAVSRTRSDEARACFWALVFEDDRTRRVDKNYEKFRRYDAFLCWWWLYPVRQPRSAAVRAHRLPDPSAARQFVSGGGSRAHRTPLAPERRSRTARVRRRRRILFALEHDARNGLLEAWQLPAFPPAHPAHPARDAAVRLVRLGGRVPDSSDDTTE
jgi:hypothetical protein